MRPPFPFLWFALIAALTASSVAEADTPASQVTTQPVGAGQHYPEVAAHGEGWFDVGGFCKVVDVGDLSWATPTANAVPVFIPGPSDQWENWRTDAPGQYRGQVASTTCCRPQSNIATLCATGTNPSSVSRQYGKLGETDQVTGTCFDSHGLPFTDTLSIACNGDNGPDGQAAWQVGGDAQQCTPNAWTTTGVCQGSCGTGSQSVQVFNSCGQLTQTTSQSCNTGVSCCTPNWQKSGCNGSTAQICDVSCGGGCYDQPGGCSCVSDGGCTQWCNGTNFWSYCDDNGNCCYYQDCGDSWYSSGSDCSGSCTTSDLWVFDYCITNTGQVSTTYQDAGVDRMSCTGTCTWQ
jgi:hypothetical protein